MEGEECGFRSGVGREMGGTKVREDRGRGYQVAAFRAFNERWDEETGEVVVGESVYTEGPARSTSENWW